MITLAFPPARRSPCDVQGGWQKWRLTRAAWPPIRWPVCPES